MSNQTLERAPQRANVRSFASSGHHVKHASCGHRLETYTGGGGSGKAPGNYYGTVKRHTGRFSQPHHQHKHHHQHQSQQQQHSVTAATTEAPVEKRQHQQNVEVVDVPEARKFFIYNIATRQETLSKLNLNSLIEYIEHLESYRVKNRERIEQFNDFYFPVIKGEKMRDPDLDEKPEDLIDPIAKLNVEVEALLQTIDKKLEACQVKRLLTSNDIDNLCSGVIGGAAGGASGGQQSSSAAASAASADAMMLPNVDRMEVIDLTCGEMNESEAPSDDAGESTYYTQQVQFEHKSGNDLEAYSDMLDDRSVTVNVAHNIRGMMRSETKVGQQQSAIRDALIDQLQNRLGELELALKKREKVIDVIQPAVENEDEKEEDEMQAGEKATTDAFALSTLAAPFVGQSDDGTLRRHKSNNRNLDNYIGAKIAIGGYQLPLPKDFNRISQVEKNAILCKLPEMVRGNYLSMCWESRFFEQLSQTGVKGHGKVMLDVPF